jgi:hypothetical protein
MSYVTGDTLRDFLQPFLIKIIDPQDGYVSSGFFISEEGLVLTCWHVVDPAFTGNTPEFLTVEYGEKNKKVYKTVVDKACSNRDKDIAVLEIMDADFQKLKEAGFEAAPLGFPY